MMTSYRMEGEMMRERLTQEEQQRLEAEFLCQDRNSGMVGSYCEEGMPFYYANEAFVAMLGYDNITQLLSDANGRGCDIIHPDDLAQLLQEIGELYEGKTYDATYRMRAGTAATSGWWIRARSSARRTAGWWR